MKILHTSDWHLGRSLYGRKRYDEFSQFLGWLGTTIEAENVDALLVAGDVFDTSTPSNRAQELYYNFLCTVSRSCCRHVVIIAGNHDSPSFLNAPKEILKALNVHVVGSITDNPEDEIIVLRDRSQKPEAIVCAVPYLRDKDIRVVEAGETIKDKNEKLIEGLTNHYGTVCDIAEKKRAEFKKDSGVDIPIIAMGHLFTVGGKTVDGDGVRELYVGSLAHVAADRFPSSIDYLALGHLHVPQCVGNTDYIRYCGAPIPMGYGEARQNKKVIIVEFNSTTPDVRDIQVPCFQHLERIVGSLDEIESKIEELKGQGSSAWLEIEYTGTSVVGNLREVLEEAISGSSMEIRRIKNRQIIENATLTLEESETLDDMTVNDIFERCLDDYGVPQEEREELITAYNEIVGSLYEDDVNAE